MTNQKTFLLFLCITASLLGSGCMSARMVTDLKPGKNAELKSPSGKFYIADVKFSPAGGGQNPQLAETYKKYQRQLLPLLQKECLDRYPALFTNDSTYAIPLGVTTETVTTMHTIKMMCWMYGTLLISGVILPVPGDSDEDITVKAGVWTGREDLQSAAVQKNFRREIHSWVSLLTPAALITIPGESDFPKVSGSLFDMQKMETVYLQQFASQLATALAETVAAKDPSFWTAQPRRIETPALAVPARSTTAPVALPLPTETVAPF